MEVSACDQDVGEGFVLKLKFLNEITVELTAELNLILGHFYS